MKTNYLKKTSRYILLVILIGAAFHSNAQDVVLESQADVDAFDPLTMVIDGDLLIYNSDFSNSSDISDLSNLSNLTSVSGSVSIRYNDNLTNLDGLDNLTIIGQDLTIEYNENLTSVGLNNLTTIGGFFFLVRNQILTNLNGLGSLISIGEYFEVRSNNLITFEGLNNLTSIGDDLVLRGNSNLINLDGLSSLEVIGDQFELNQTMVLLNIDALINLDSIGNDLFISGNQSLTNLDGFSNLSYIGKDLTIRNHEVLLNVDGFSNLTSMIGELRISNNSELININGFGNLTNPGTSIQLVGNGKLENLHGLSNITSIPGELRLTSNNSVTDLIGLDNIAFILGDFSLLGMNNITDLDALSNLTSLGDNLVIRGNEKLTNLDGLSNITNIDGYLSVGENSSLVNCCGVQYLVENKESLIGGFAAFFDNISGCSSDLEVLDSSCGMKLTISTTSPCIDINNGIIQLFIDGYETIPFNYEWMRQEDGVTGSGVSQTDNFSIDNLGAGTYNITVTNTQPDTVVKSDIVLSQTDGSIFEIVEVNTTNSSNGQNNGSITVKTDGGTGPYNYTWSGEEDGSQSGVTEDFYTIPNLGYGEYTITVEDASTASNVVEISLLDEVVQVIPCEQPLDIVILNDVSGSVDVVEYLESKQFFVNFLEQANIGTGADESRAAIIEWSSPDEQEIKIPITGDLSALQSYLDDTRAFGANTAPHQAIIYGTANLNNNVRPDVEKVLILSTDAEDGQISSSLIALADVYKAQGFHIISIAFDNAFSNNITREILRKVASTNALAPGAAAYSLLDQDLAQQIVFNYLCPIDPGSSATAYFNRDGAIDIVEIVPTNSCPFPEFVEVTFDISAHRELSIPAGTYVTFYHNNPFQAGATQILTWQIPCAIPVDSTERYTVTLPMEGPSNIFAVLNDDGIQGAPIDFPITTIDEIAYTNNIDNARICLDTEATIQALKFSALPIPACDTLVTYTINVCNISEVDAFGVSVEDVPPTGFVLTGQVFNDNGCATDQNGIYDIPSDCCLSLTLTYDVAGAEFGYYGDQDVILSGPDNQTYIDFDGNTTTDEDVTLDGTIDCPSTNITFTKSVNIDESCDDGFVEFTFTITNEMNIPLQGLKFTDILPDPCTWAYIPYGEEGLSIANPMIMDEQAIFTIDEVAANTVATFYMDASLNLWNADGTLNNTATLENVPDVINGGFKTLTSNTTTTEITASPSITLPDTIIVDTGSDSVNLEALLSSLAEVVWASEGDGTFTEATNQNTTYIFGEEDITNGEVSLFISAISECNETGASSIVIMSGCSDNANLEIQLTAENLSCNIDLVEIIVTSTIDLDNVLWSGPSNEGQNGFNLLVSEPGDYKIIGSAGNCQDTVTISIEESLADRMESYTICEGEQIEIYNEVYNSAGMYEQILISESDCDTTLHIDLEVLENTMGEETYILTSGEILDINGVQYDAEGQYIQDLTGANGCDSILIINIIEDLTPLITFDFDDCSAWVQTMNNADYSEFTPFYNRELDCGDVVSSNIYREDPFENKHSCTEGLNESYSMCISSETSCDFDINSTKMVRMDIDIDPNPDSEIVINAIDFYQQAPENFSWINGDGGVNNYPTQFGIRILRDGEEIYFEENISTALTWQKEAFNFSGNDDFVFAEAAKLEVLLLPYCPIGADSPVTAWDLEDLKIFGSCATLIGSKKVVAGIVERHHNAVLNNVQIILSNDTETKQIMANEQGKYAFLGNEPNSYINITAHKDDNHLMGVNSYDLQEIQRHLLGLDQLDDPLQYIASDVNYDGKISTEDLRDLRDLILGISTEFPSNDSYRFLNKKELQKNNTLWWELPENIEIQSLNNHMLYANFIPVKIGDVTDKNNGDPLDINTSEVEITESMHTENTDTGSESSIIFKLPKLVVVNGIHFSIDLKSIHFEGVKSDLRDFSEENYYLTEEGILNISWTDVTNSESVSELFTLKFSEQYQPDLINDVLISEVHTHDKKNELESNYTLSKEDQPSISNLIVYPNPVNRETIISFEQSNAKEVIFSIQNLERKMVYQDVLESKKGLNRIILPENLMLQNSGIFILRLTDDSGSLVEKIMILE